MRIGFLGAGNMGGAILRGYAPFAVKNSNVIFVYNRTESTRLALEQEFEAVHACASLDELVENSDVIILGIKPNIFPEMLSQVAKKCTVDKLIVSMAAGISIDFIEKYLGKEQPIVRIMPNTPAQVGEAMTSVCRNHHVDDARFQELFKVFESIGKAEEVEEELIHCVIGVSGSSPAYTYMYIDALAEAAVENGMSAEKARVFAAQSVLGAAKMVLENENISVEQLRINVCSPGGTTIEAVNKLQENGFVTNIKEGMQAAIEKSKKMTN